MNCSNLYLLGISVGILAIVIAEISQIHIAQGRTPSSMTISWTTSLSSVSEVRYGITELELDQHAFGLETYYTFLSPPPSNYSDLSENYTSSKIHHVVLDELLPGTTYYYQCGDFSSSGSGSDTSLLSGILAFTTLPMIGFPGEFSLGVIADLGTTVDSLSTVYHMVANKELRMILDAGDLSYADCNQQMWDTYSTFMQVLATDRPWMVAPGNHETEQTFDATGAIVTHTAFEHRFKMPAVKPAEFGEIIYPAWYSDARTPVCTPSVYQREYNYGNSFYSFEVASVHVIFLNPYTTTNATSAQYRWLQDDLGTINRKITPWVVVVMHCPWYNSNRAHDNEWQTVTMRESMEDLFYEHHVNIVIAGHVHAYERTYPVYRDAPTRDGPMYVVVGAGGNDEGHYPDYFQPAPSWSAFRDGFQFGHGELRFLNRDELRWTWHRNIDTEVIDSDSVRLCNSYYAAADCSDLLYLRGGGAAHSHFPPTHDHRHHGPPGGPLPIIIITFFALLLSCVLVIYLSLSFYYYGTIARPDKILEIMRNGQRHNSNNNNSNNNNSGIRRDNNDDGHDGSGGHMQAARRRFLGQEGLGDGGGGGDGYVGAESSSLDGDIETSFTHSSTVHTHTYLRAGGGENSDYEEGEDELVEVTLNPTFTNAPLPSGASRTRSRSTMTNSGGTIAAALVGRLFDYSSSTSSSTAAGGSRDYQYMLSSALSEAETTSTGTSTITSQDELLRRSPTKQQHQQQQQQQQQQQRSAASPPPGGAILSEEQRPPNTEQQGASTDSYRRSSSYHHVPVVSGSGSSRPPPASSAQRQLDAVSEGEGEGGGGGSSLSKKLLNNTNQDMNSSINKTFTTSTSNGYDEENGNDNSPRYDDALLTVTATTQEGDRVTTENNNNISSYRSTTATITSTSTGNRPCITNHHLLTMMGEEVTSPGGEEDQFI